MPRLLGCVPWVFAVLCWAAGPSSAQTTTSSTQTKDFDVIAVNGNDLVVKLPEGTREMTVPDDFRFTVNGQAMSVHELQPGMKGTATITTRTRTTPVTVTEVKNGQVLMTTGGNIYVRTDGDVKMFDQADIDKRGIKLMRDGKPAQVSDFRTGDRLSATIVTAGPPKVVTEREVQATLARIAAASNAAPPQASAPSQVAANAPSGGAARTLPKTASSRPLMGLLGLMSLGIAAALATRRRRQARA